MMREVSMLRNATSNLELFLSYLVVEPRISVNNIVAWEGRSPMTCSSSSFKSKSWWTWWTWWTSGPFTLFRGSNVESIELCKLCRLCPSCGSAPSSMIEPLDWEALGPSSRSSGELGDSGEIGEGEASSFPSTTEVLAWDFGWESLCIKSLLVVGVCSSEGAEGAGGSFPFLLRSFTSQATLSICRDKCLKQSAHIS